MTGNRTGGSKAKLHQWKFSLDVRKRFFTERLIGHWNRLPGETVTSSNLSDFKKYLDNAHSVR